jgi:hypothetical protein
MKPKQPKPSCRNCVHDDPSYGEPCKRIGEHLRKGKSMMTFQYCKPGERYRFWHHDGSTR